MYKVYNNLDNEFSGISVGDMYIPLDPANSDYQKCLDEIIKQGADCFTGDIPAELQTAADAKLFNTHPS